ncbi:MAG: chaperonin GroEL [Planctomycetaceae bacterium]|nr:chaperonin GroEL [Planctomycetaceae bacterium]
MAKQMMFDADGWAKVQSGVRRIAEAVRVTLGPSGKNVLLEKKWGSPLSTRDGVTVSKEIELKDPFENMGAKLVNEVASKTSDTAGDGTTTATVLAERIFSEGLKAVVSGANPMAVKRGMDAAVAKVVAEVKSVSRPVKGREQIVQVGTISANQDRAIGELLADAIEKVGKDGVITVEEAKGIETTLECVEGMQFDKGFISPYFITNPENLRVELEDALVFVHEKKISALRELLPLLEQVARAGKPLLVVAEDVDGEALAALVVNRLRGVLKVCAVKAPGFGDRRKAMLGDLAVVTGGKFFSEDLGDKLESVQLSDLGSAKRITVTKDETTVVEGAGTKKAIQERIDQVRSQIEKATSDYDREKLQERLARLAGGVAVIKVGAATEAESKDKKARVEDALHATRAAVEEGIVPGGGTTLLRAASVIDALAKDLRGDERIGARVVQAALRGPAFHIAENTGRNGSVVVEEILERKDPVGFDAVSGEFVDLWKAGIVDPAKVTRTALQNAVSIAGLLLTTSVMVTELKENDRSKAVAGATL